MQRSQADFRLGDHTVAGLDLAGEGGVDLLEVDHRTGRRELARADRVAAGRVDVDPVRALGDGDVEHVGVARCAPIDDGDHRVADSDGLTRAHRILDRTQVEYRQPVAVIAHHIGQVHPALAIVTGAHRILARVVGGAEVEIAVDCHLPLDRHRLGVDAGVHRNIVAEIVGGLAIVVHRNGKFGVAVDILEGVARRKNTVRALAVGQFDDGIGLHKIQADPRQAPLRLVVDETELPVVPTVLIG